MDKLLLIYRVISVACYSARSQTVESALTAICFSNAAAFSTTHSSTTIKISNALYLSVALQTYLHCRRAAQQFLFYWYNGRIGGANVLESFDDTILRQRTLMGISESFPNISRKKGGAC